MLPTHVRSFLCTPLVALVLLTGCASSVTYVPTTLFPTAAAEPSPFVTIAKQIDVTLDTGYIRTLKENSQWRHIGRITQGDVYKSHNAIFTLEGTHVHEACLVIANGNLSGFYLPVERGYSALKYPVALTLLSTQK
jgi:hypothetical protein